MPSDMFWVLFAVSNEDLTKFKELYNVPYYHIMCAFDYYCRKNQPIENDERPTEL